MFTVTDEGKKKEKNKQKQQQKKDWSFACLLKHTVENCTKKKKKKFGRQ